MKMNFYEAMAIRVNMITVACFSKCVVAVVGQGLRCECCRGQGPGLLNTLKHLESELRQKHHK